MYKSFGNDNTFQSHLRGKKHIKNAEARNGTDTAATNGASAPKIDTKRLRERAIAEREHRIRSLAEAMQTTRSDTRINVERKFGMTDKERQQEIAALYAEEEAALATQNGNGEGSSGQPSSSTDAVVDHVLAGKKHKFDDHEYIEQTKELSENVKSAVSAAFLKKKKKNGAANGNPNKKAKLSHEEEGSSPKDKTKEKVEESKEETVPVPPIVSAIALDAVGA